MNASLTGAAKSRMNKKLKESMLTRLMAQPELLAECKSLIEPGHFRESDEVAYAILWNAILQCHERFGTLTYDTLTDLVELISGDSAAPLNEYEAADLLSDDPEQPGLV